VLALGSCVVYAARPSLWGSPGNSGRMARPGAVTAQPMLGRPASCAACGRGGVWVWSGGQLLCGCCAGHRANLCCASVLWCVPKPEFCSVRVVHHQHHRAYFPLSFCWKKPWLLLGFSDHAFSRLMPCFDRCMSAGRFLQKGVAVAGARLPVNSRRRGSLWQVHVCRSITADGGCCGQESLAAWVVHATCMCVSGPRSIVCRRPCMWAACVRAGDVAWGCGGCCCQGLICASSTHPPSGCDRGVCPLRL
jgi:hypothetical protein